MTTQAATPATPAKKPKKCPSCQEPVIALQLSAFAMPIEQQTIPWLKAINREVGVSYRTFGTTALNELQFLSFTSTCLSCGLISWWDLATPEFEAILDGTDKSIAIRWASNPDAIKTIIDKLSDAEMKKPFQSLLIDISPSEGQT